MPLEIKIDAQIGPDTPQYIARPEDDRLEKMCLEGQWALVRGPRQKGKSTLLNGVQARLRKAGHWTASASIPVEDQPPASFTKELQRTISKNGEQSAGIELGKRFEGWHISVASEPWTYQWELFFEEFLLPLVPQGITFTLFLDETDRLLKLPFRDAFFLKMRELHENRTARHVYQKLSIVFAGYEEMLEGGLIQQKDLTPFNVVETVLPGDLDLLGLQRKLSPKLQGSPEQNDRLLAAIHELTQGHPGLTMRLLKHVLEVEEDPASWSVPRVQQLAEQLFHAGLRNTDEMHFQRITDKLRDQSIPGLMDFYEKVLRGKRPRYDESAASRHLLDMGIIKSDEDKRLVMHNPIYAWMYNLDWCLEENPRPPLRRRIAAWVAAHKLEITLALVVLVALAGTWASFRLSKSLLSSQTREVSQKASILATTAQLQLEQRVQSKVPALLAMASLHLEYSPEAEEVFHRALRLIDNTPVHSIVLRQLKGGSRGVVKCLAFGATPHQMATGSYDGLVHLWNYDTESLIRTLPGHSGAITAIAFSRNGKLLASGSMDSTIRVWEVQSGTLLHTLKGHFAAIKSLEFNKDGHFLASSSVYGQGGRQVMVWRLRDGLPIPERFYASGDPHYNLTFEQISDIEQRFKASFKPLRQSDWCEHGSSGWCQLLLGFQDGFREAEWQLMEWRDDRYGPPLSPESKVFSSDGRSTAEMVEGSNIVIVRNTLLPQRVRTFKNVRETMTGLAISADGGYLGIATNEQHVEIYISNLRTEIAYACAILKGNLSREEWVKYAPSVVPYQRSCLDLPEGL